jgi:uncharacterized membrane protein YkoI
MKLKKEVKSKNSGGNKMKKIFKLLGAATLLATIIPLSAYAATQNQAKTPDTAAPVAIVATQVEAPDLLQKAAKITEQQASDAALKRVKGTVKKIELEDENGVAVYVVKIVDANGKGFDVKVDAATGKVTKAESDDENDDEENDKDEN